MIPGWLAGRRAGGLLLRRLLPLAIVLPVAIESLCLWGVQTGQFGPVAAATLTALLDIGLAGALLLLTASALDRYEIDREHDAERMWASRRQLAAIVDSADDAIISKGLDGVIRTWNHGAERMFGYTGDEMIGQSIRRLIPDSRRGEESRIVQRIASGAQIRHYESVRQCKDGTLIDVSLTISPITDSRGCTIGASKIVRDITARKRSEAALAAAKAHLEQRVAERTAELTAANQELEAFAYAVAHDLRAPLRAMTGFSDALIEDYAAALPAGARDYLDQIKTGGRHMAELIDGLLVLSRCTRGEMQRDTIDISALAGRIRLELTRDNPGRAVRWTIEPNLQIRGDARMFEVVMRTLLSNAWKFTARAPQPEIRVYLESTGNGETRICVRDNGAGFDMKHADKLFRPFQRLHRQEEYPGTGVGLATAQRIIHRHGGTIGASATIGGGATFSFGLPAQPVAMEAA